jgi:hypothetical protein
MTDLGIFLTTHPWMLHAIAVIALVTIFGVFCAIAAYFEPIRTQRSLHSKREFAQDLVPGLRRNVQC